MTRLPLSETQVDRSIAAMEERLQPFDLAWRQELTLTVCNRARLAFAKSEVWANVVAERGDPAAANVAPERTLAFTVEQALARSGVRRAGRFRRRTGVAAKSFFATLAALIGLAVLALRSLRWPRLAWQRGRTVVVLHAEAANRTAHVRKALAQRDPASTDLVLAGRPHVSASRVRAMLDEAGWTGGFALAWDWRAAIGGLREGLRIARQAGPAMLAAGYQPGFAPLLAIQLRILIGTASAWRWRHGERRAEAVVFGHTGRADTVLLERAMQAGGARSVHWMHGLSDGRSYQGVSDLCVTLCRYDCEWHDRALDYRRNVAFALPRPAFRTGPMPGCVVMTNLTHPDYAPFAEVGPAHELALIETVREWALGEGADPGSVVWKPHPVFYWRDAETRAAVSRAVAEAGFTLWPEPAMPFGEAAEYETLVVTPSGIAVDMLKQGRIPVMAAMAPIEPEHVLARFPVRVHDVASLRNAVAILQDRAQAERLFEQTWEAVGPGEAGDLERIERELGLRD